MKKLLGFLFAIGTSASLISCSFFDSVFNEEQGTGSGNLGYENSGFDFGEDTTPATSDTSSTGGGGTSGNNNNNNNPSTGKDSTPKEIKYKVYFYNGDEYIGFLDLKEGTQVTKDIYTKIPSDTPIYPNEQEGYHYTFIGWNEDRQTNDIGSAVTYTVTKDIDLYAVYSQAKKQYNVFFVNEGESLRSKSFDHGSKLEKTNTYGYNVSKEPTEQYSYVFDGWNETSTASSGVEYTVTRDMTVHAIYKQTIRQYSVTFKNGSTTLKGPTSYNYGVIPTYSGTPSKAETGVTYTFVGWSEDSETSPTSANVYASNNLPAVNHDTVYYAIFSSSTNTYSITFMNGNSQIGSPVSVNHGQRPTAPTNPTKNNDTYSDEGRQVRYTFVGWSTDSSATATSSGVYASNNLPVATKDDTYYAVFSSKTYYNVLFYNGSTKLQDNYVESGIKPTYSGSQPTKSGYTFNGWNTDPNAANVVDSFPSVTAKTTYFAIFTINTSSGGSSNPGSNAETGLDSIDTIELDVENKTGNSAFSQEVRIPIGSYNLSQYDISHSYDDSSDSNYFNVSISGSDLVARAKLRGRFTYLHVTYMNKGTSTVAKTQDITLLSVSTQNLKVDNFDKQKVAEDTNIATGSFASVAIDSNSVFAEGNDLVIPSKVRVNGTIKEVAQYSSGKHINVRRMYFPKTVFYVGTYVCGDKASYVHFSMSQRGYIVFQKNSLYYTGYSKNYFLDDSSCFMNSSKYYFPYTKLGVTSNGYNYCYWNNGSVTYNSWNWQTDFANKSDRSSIRNSLSRYVCFKN